MIAETEIQCLSPSDGGFVSCVNALPRRPGETSGETRVRRSDVIHQFIVAKPVVVVRCRLSLKYSLTYFNGNAMGLKAYDFIFIFAA